jgi:hypothetical protein
MATSTCVKCDGTSFEVKEAKLKGSAYRMYFIQCSSCGGALGVQEYFNTGAMLDKQNKAIKAIARAVGVSVEL